MAGRTMTLTLPSGLCERVQATAHASACSVEEMCAQLVALSSAVGEGEVPQPLREEFARWRDVHSACFQLWRNQARKDSVSASPSAIACGNHPA